MNLGLPILLLVAATQPKPPPISAVEPPVAAPARLLASARGDAAMARKDPAAALTYFDAAWTAGKDSGDAYNAACAADHLGKEDLAWAWINRSVDGGFSDADGMAADDDLKPLRTRPGWDKLLAKARSNPTPSRLPTSPEVLSIVSADQAERSGPLEKMNAKTMEANDRQRRQQIASLAKNGGLKTAHDYLGAALVFQHGESLDDYAQARGYALEAIRRGDPAGYRMVVLTWDRWLVEAGYPQRFGSQYDGQGHRLPVDPAVTDADRAKWGIQPLAEIPSTASF